MMLETPFAAIMFMSSSMLLLSIVSVKQLPTAIVGHLDRGSPTQPNLEGKQSNFKAPCQFGMAGAPRGLQVFPWVEFCRPCAVMVVRNMARASFPDWHGMHVASHRS